MFESEFKIVLTKIEPPFPAPTTNVLTFFHLYLSLYYDYLSHAIKVLVLLQTK